MVGSGLVKRVVKLGVLNVEVALVVVNMGAALVLGGGEFRYGRWEVWEGAWWWAGRGRRGSGCIDKVDAMVEVRARAMVVRVCS